MDTPTACERQDGNSPPIPTPCPVIPSRSTLFTLHSSLFTLLLALALLAARPYAGSWNDGSRLATVECLVDQGTLAIDDSIFVAVPSGDAGASNPYRGPALENGTLDKLAIDGHFYSDKSPVPALWLAIIYQALQWFFGLKARLSPEAFCWCMTVASSGLAYVAAVVAVVRIGRLVGLPQAWRLALAGSFGLATVAVVYVQHVNNHILLLGVACVLMLEAGQLLFAAPWWRLLLLGSLGGLGYAIDLGAGPPLLVCTGLLVAWQCGLRAACGWFTAGAMPWLALHHALNYAVGGTFGPANAVPDYFNWDGSPFHGATLTGNWHHESLSHFATYAAGLLFGKRGILVHNLPLLLLLPGIRTLCSPSVRERPVLLMGAIWSAGTWLVYAAASSNSSGICLSVRWLVPLLAPGYYALGVLLARRPSYRPVFVALSAWGVVLMGIAWSSGPWAPCPGWILWPIVAAALTSWGCVLWSQRKLNSVVVKLSDSGSLLATRVAMEDEAPSRADRTVAPNFNHLP